MFSLFGVYLTGLVIFVLLDCLEVTIQKLDFHGLNILSSK
jgi:hypothetical protein